MNEEKELPRFYITFGQQHICKHGDKIIDNNCVGVIKAESYKRMREIAFEMFGENFATTYTEIEINKVMHYFPRGLIELN